MILEGLRERQKVTQTNGYLNHININNQYGNLLFNL
jgi:hypothetical protein